MNKNNTVRPMSEVMKEAVPDGPVNPTDQQLSAGWASLQRMCDETTKYYQEAPDFAAVLSRTRAAHPNAMDEQIERWARSVEAARPAWLR